MKKLSFPIRTMTAAFLCGSLFFGGIALADQQVISFDKLKLIVSGSDRSSADGQYDNGGTKVPEAIIYEGTTYVPVRKISELVGLPVYWDGGSKAVSIGSAHVELMDTAGKPIGHAELTEGDKGVKVHTEVTGLTPGKHGLHVHEKAIAGVDLKSAGGHFNPSGKHHGHDNPEGMHIGDLPNLEADSNGHALAEYTIEGATLQKGKDNSLLGRSLVIHASEDDYKTDPSGNSGDRIAGGNIPQ